MSSKKYIYIVQVTRQLSIDILNNFINNNTEVILVTGAVESNYASLDNKVKVKYLNKYISTSTFKRLFTWLIFHFRAFFYVLFKSKEYELILVTTPPFIIFLGSFFKRFRKQKSHLIIWDLYPDVLLNFGVLKKSSFMLKWWQKKNVKCFHNADSIFTLGIHLQEAINAYTSNEIKIIPNWTNTDFIKPINKNENIFIEKYQLKGKFVVMYSGNLGLTHNIEAIIESAKSLQDNPHIKFIIIGEGPKKQKIENLLNTYKLNNVLLLPYQDKETLPYSLTAADIGVVTLSEGAENISVPSKTYYMLAAGTSILALASKKSELGLLIERYNCGKVFEGSDVNKISLYITELYEKSTELEAQKQNSRKASFDYSPENAKLYYDYICRK